MRRIQPLGPASSPESTTWQVSAQLDSDVSRLDRVDLRVNDFMAAVEFKEKMLGRLVDKNKVPYSEGEED